MNAALTIWTFSEYLLRCLTFFWQTNNRTEWDVNKSIVCTHPVSPEKRSSWVIKDTCVVDCGRIGRAYTWLVLHSHCVGGGGGEQSKTKTEFSECSVSEMIDSLWFKPISVTLSAHTVRFCPTSPCSLLIHLVQSNSLTLPSFHEPIPDAHSVNQFNCMHLCSSRHWRQPTFPN